MSQLIHDELAALCERWRARAKTFMAEARSTRPADMVRLTAMASTLEWAAADLSVYTKPVGITDPELGEQPATEGI